MTQPAPAPGAPVEPVTPPAPAAPPAAPTPPAEDLASLPEWAQKQIREARAEAAKSRTTAKQTAADEARQETLAQVAKALGIGKEGEPVDPAALTTQIEQAQAAAWVSGVELQIHRLAGRLGADAEALLDSNAFRDTLDDLVDTDPRSADFATALEAKVQAALEKNPGKYKTAGQAPAGAGAPRPDPSQGPRGEPPVKRAASLKEALDRHYKPAGS
jgi:hypothetical protein